MNRALFIDRDGVINELVYYPSHGEWESPRVIDDLKLHPNINEPLLAAQRAGWLLFLVTNQPSYAKGKCSLESLQEIQASVMRQLSENGVRIAEAYVCFHHPTSKLPGYGPCECRKPSPFFIRQAAVTHNIDLARSWVVGDQDTDMETGKNAGVRTALLSYDPSAPKRGKVEADLNCADLADFVRRVIE